MHSHHFHLARQPGLCLSAWEHAQAVHPIKLLAQSQHHFGAEQLTHPNLLLDTAQSQHWACPMCQNRHSPWAQRTTCLLHGYSWRRGCHCEGAPEEHLEVWEQCRLTGDMEPLWGMLMAHVKEEERGSNVCVSGPAAGEFSAGNTGLSS